MQNRNKNRRPVSVSSLRLFATTLLGAFATSALAEEYHYTNMIVGERPAGMGGAYIAVSDDASGLYYNPAGIAYSTGRNLSASVNAHRTSNIHYKDVLGGAGWDREASALLPNYFGMVQPLAGGVFGFSYAVPDSAMSNQDQVFYGLPSSIPGTTIDRYVINYNDRDTTYQIGPSFAREINKSLSVGMTLYYHRREHETINNQLINLSDGRYQWTNTYNEIQETGLRPIFGLMWEVADKYALGVTLSKVIVLDSDGVFQRTFKDLSYNGNTVDRAVLRNTDKREHPVVLAIGLAHFPSDRLLLSADMTHYTATDDTVQGKHDAVTNLALGAEYFFSSNWAWRVGLFTNNANTPEVASGGTNQAEHVNIYGLSTSISRLANNTSTTLGLTYSFGKGKAQLFSDTSIQDVERDELVVFLAASYSY